MAILLEGGKPAEHIKSKVKEQVLQLQKEYGVPSLHAILVGNNPASETYVAKKVRTCQEIGMQSQLHQFEAKTLLENIIDKILELNKNDDVHGILVQLPLPEGISKYNLMECIDPRKDVDGFTPDNVTRVYWGKEGLEPCTPKGIISLLDHYRITVKGKNVVIMGTSEIVGRPLGLMLMHQGATVTYTHIETQNIAEHTCFADILAVAIGKPGYVTAQMVKEGATVIDVGINRVPAPNQKGYRIVGDVDYSAVVSKAAYLTPVPGGVGPLTVAYLMENTLKAFKIQKGIKHQATKL